jgi:hypothetical protein
MMLWRAQELDHLQDIYICLSPCIQGHGGQGANDENDENNWEKMNKLG